MQRDLAGELLIDCAGVFAGYRLDHGCDGRAIERRHEDADLGKADELLWELAGVSADADDRAAQLYRGGKVGATDRSLLWLRFICALEDHDRAGSGGGGLLAEAIAVDHPCFRTEDVLAQQTRDGLNQIMVRNLDDGHHVGVLEAGERATRGLECVTEQYGRRRVFRVQDLDGNALALVVAVIVELQGELLGAVIFPVRQGGPQARQLSARAQGVDQHLGQGPRRGGEHTKPVHVGEPI